MWADPSFLQKLIIVVDASMISHLGKSSALSFFYPIKGRLGIAFETSSVCAAHCWRFATRAFSARASGFLKSTQTTSPFRSCCFLATYLTNFPHQHDPLHKGVKQQFCLRTNTQHVANSHPSNNDNARNLHVPPNQPASHYKIQTTKHALLLVLTGHIPGYHKSLTGRHSQILRHKLPLVDLYGIFFLWLVGHDYRPKSRPVLAPPPCRPRRPPSPRSALHDRH